MTHCAVITPVGPGHTRLYQECLASIQQAAQQAGAFTRITPLPVDDSHGLLGRSRARNIGVQQAREQGADWIFFLDADDLMAPDAFQQVTPFLSSHHAIWGLIAELKPGAERLHFRSQLTPGEDPLGVLALDPYYSIQMGHFVRLPLAQAHPFDEQRDTGEDFAYYLELWTRYRCIKIGTALFANRRGMHATGPRSADGTAWRQATQTLLSDYLNGQAQQGPWAKNPWSKRDHVPRVLVSLLVWDATPYVYNLLTSLKDRLPARCPFRILIQDQGSDEETRQMLQRFADALDNVTVLWNDENTGFSAGHNRNYDYAQQQWGAFDYFVPLNSDVVFAYPYWLDAMALFMEDHPDVALAGPHLLGMHTEPETRGHGRPASTEEIAEGSFKAVSGCLCIIRCSVVARYGLYDEAYTPGYFEDSDMSARYRAAGWHLALVQVDYLHHYLGQGLSTAKQKREELMRVWGADYQERNRQRYLQRWEDGGMDLSVVDWPTQCPQLYFPTSIKS